MIRYFVIHNKEMNRYEPMCLLYDGGNENRPKELFEDYISKSLKLMMNIEKLQKNNGI